jgi:hypothetical protein
VQCQSHAIHSHYHKDKYYFHIGCGDCSLGNNDHHIPAELGVYMGIGQLMDTLRRHDFKNVLFMLYSLSNHLEKLCYTKIEGYEAGNVTLNSVKYSGEYLRKILKHIQGS